MRPVCYPDGQTGTFSKWYTVNVRNFSTIAKIVGLAALLGGALTLSFFAANYVAQNDAAQALVERFGYVGILLISIIAGLNLLVPIPAATFTPIYEAAGLSLPAIIAVLVIGTFIADAISYLIGIGGRSLTAERFKDLQTRILHFAEAHRAVLPVMVFLYAAFMPFPNEAIVVPLGFIGVPFRLLIIPLLLGNVVHQTLLTYGAVTLFGVFF